MIKMLYCKQINILILYLFYDYRNRIKSNSNKLYINCRNNRMLNNNIMINYLKNNKLNTNLNNINKSNNNHSIKNESNYFHFNNDYSKDLINRRNRVNIFEENSKLINSRKLLNIGKNKEESSKQNTFDRDTNIEKTVNNNNAKNSRSHNKKKDLLNKIRIYSLNEKTITYEKLFKKREEKKNNKTLINFNYKKIRNKDTKYIKYKKEIFEKVAKNISNIKNLKINDKHFFYCKE